MTVSGPETFAACMECWKGAEFSRFVGTIYASHAQEVCGTALDDTSATCSAIGCTAPTPNQRDLGDNAQNDCQRALAKASLNYLLKREKIIDRCLLKGLSFGACLADPKLQLPAHKGGGSEGDADPELLQQLRARRCAAVLLPNRHGPDLHGRRRSRRLSQQPERYGQEGKVCSTTTCVGGGNNGAACTTASECPGGACGGSCDNIPGPTNRSRGGALPEQRALPRTDARRHRRRHSMRRRSRGRAGRQRALPAVPERQHAVRRRSFRHRRLRRHPDGASRVSEPGVCSMIQAPRDRRRVLGE